MNPSGYLKLQQIRYYSNRILNLNSILHADVLLSRQNKENCINCMKKSKIIRQSNSAPNKTTTKCAAVLIPICVNNKGEVSLLFTRRSGNLSRHVRQVSFPGGIKDDTDKSFEECALRETEEEIGLPRNRVDIWSTAEMIRPPNTVSIVPVIGVIRDLSLEELSLNSKEVDEVFRVPVVIFCNERCKRHTQFRTGFSTPCYIIDPERKIWGITAAITNMFLNCFLPKEAYTSKIEYIKPVVSKITAPAAVTAAVASGASKQIQQQ